MGEYLHTMDEKGRLILPAKFREKLGERFVATKGLDQCLFVYPENEWVVVENKLKQLPLAKPEARAFLRFFFSGAAVLEADKQRRILLPNNLREYAQIEKDVVVIGVAARVEIWSKPIWDQYAESVNPTVTQIAENLIDLGL